MKHLTTGIALAAMLTANAALADGSVIKFGHDNKADPFENPAHACTAVFANSLAAGTNGASRSRFSARTSWARLPNTSSRSATASFRPR